MLKLDDFKKARNELEEVLVSTPLEYSATFSRYTGHKIWVKPENLQKTGSFKIRGAYTRISRLSEEEKKAGVITASSGNHGQAVAHAAASLGVSSLVVMPEDAPEAKCRAVASYGGEILKHGHYADERKAHARELAEDRHLIYVDSTDDADIIAGQGTCYLEILEELPDVDAVVAPIGGGGLISGISRASRVSSPDVQVVGVEPEGSCCMYRSVQRGHPVEVEVKTIADGLRTKKPGELPFEYAAASVDRFFQVTEEEITDALLVALQRMKLLLEPSGAVSLAGVLKGAVPGSGKNVVVILSGGNVDLSLISEIIDDGLKTVSGADFRP